MATVDFMVISDAATAAEGKLYIHGGGWDTLFATSFPVTHPVLSVAVRVSVPWNETNQQHHLELDVVDADEQSILAVPPGPLRGQFNVGRPIHLVAASTQFIPVVLNLAGLTFQAPGTFGIVLQIDGMEAARATFNVALLPGLLAAPPPQ